MSMNPLLELDQNLFLAINGFHSSSGDALMHWVSHRLIWLPLYVLICFLLYQRLGWLQFIYAVGIFAFVLLLADQTTSGILKPLIARLRPCHDPALTPVVHLVNGKCGGPYGFASSHAANFFVLATYMSWHLRGRFRWMRVSLFGIASVVAYSRVYLGVHYPSDILVGALIGLLSGNLGILMYKALMRRLGRTYEPIN
jgi:undecaprenyl-diphosphatase